MATVLQHPNDTIEQIDGGGGEEEVEEEEEVDVEEWEGEERACDICATIPVDPLTASHAPLPIGRNTLWGMRLCSWHMDSCLANYNPPVHSPLPPDT